MDTPPAIFCPEDAVRVLNPVREHQGGRIRPGQPLYQFVTAASVRCTGVFDPGLPLVRWMMDEGESE